jgi:GNAT superfamily N-acetyltransferase
MQRIEDIANDRPTVVERVSQHLHRGLYHHFWRFGLRRSLDQTIDPPKAKIPLSVRPYESGDAEALFGHRLTSTDPGDAREIRYRLDHIAADIPTAYVAVDDTTGTACYIQWLMGSDQNAKIQAKLWGFPRLAKTEALLENAYIPPAYRGQRIMPEAMYLIAERARDIGATHALTFVTGDNMASLKGCKRAGFDIYMLHERRDYAFGLFGRNSFSVLPADDARLKLLDS